MSLYLTLTGYCCLGSFLSRVTAGELKGGPPPAVTRSVRDCPLTAYATGARPNPSRKPVERPAS